jgi:putative radical SAM enzyme (TIGR03279 family)
MIKVSAVETSSLGERLGIQPGDLLLSINGQEISDLIDYRFYQADETLLLRLKSRKGEVYSSKITKDPDEDLGLILKEPQYRSCSNKCIFCFIHQLPRGLRRSLYFKDEDYRLSFLHGNYLTVTNLTSRDLHRIGEQNLSPLYVSVHTTDERLRKQVLGNPEAPDLLPLIAKLTGLGIELHTQIVVCPGVNDGVALEKTIKDLSGFFPQVKSVAIVPVGLTKYRVRLPRIEPVDAPKAIELLSQVERWRVWAGKNLGGNFVYASDELYLLANLDIPKSGYYDDFWQVENGVGLVRQFVDDFKKGSRRFPRKISKPLKLSFVTGRAFSRTFGETVMKKLREIENLKTSLTVVDNLFFGETVTVSGLLSGKDIVAALRENTDPDTIVFLPPNCVNEEGLTLDDMTIESISKRSKREVILGHYDSASQLAGFLKKGR